MHLLYWFSWSTFFSGGFNTLVDVDGVTNSLVNSPTLRFVLTVDGSMVGGLVTLLLLDHLAVLVRHLGALLVIHGLTHVGSRTKVTFLLVHCQTFLCCHIPTRAHVSTAIVYSISKNSGHFYSKYVTLGAL